MSMNMQNPLDPGAVARLRQPAALVASPKVPAAAFTRRCRLGLLGAFALLFLALPAAATTREIDWLELLPPEDLKALLEMPEIDHSGEMLMPEVMSSTRTVAAMNGVRGKLPGYLVPIAFDDQQRVTEMFLVPYFGACIHVPPPPPNQLVFIRPENPIELRNLWDAYWVHGTLKAALTENAMAIAAYTMVLERLELAVE